METKSSANNEAWEGSVGDLRRKEKVRNNYLGHREVNGFYCTLTLSVFQGMECWDLKVKFATGFTLLKPVRIYLVLSI